MSTLWAIPYISPPFTRVKLCTRPKVNSETAYLWYNNLASAQAAPRSHFTKKIKFSIKENKQFKTLLATWQLGKN